MVFDGLALHYILTEISPLLSGGRIGKIYQPLSQELHLMIRSNRKNYRLILSVDPINGRIHTSNTSNDNPLKAPNFCLICRKYLEGARIESFEQHGNDRFLTLNFTHLNEVGDHERLQLILEIMGRHSNLVLVDHNGKIIDAIKHIDEHLNSFREILPGVSYIAPPKSGKRNPFIYDVLELETILTSLAEPADNTSNLSNSINSQTKELVHQKNENPSDLANRLATLITANFEGIAKKTAFEIVSSSIQRNCSLGQAFYDFCHHDLDPLVYKNNGTFIATPFPYSSLYSKDIIKRTESFSEAIDFSVTSSIQKNRIKQMAGDIKQLIRREIARNKQKIKKLSKQLQKTETADDYRIKGELLTAYLYEITKGQESITLNNFYANEEPITIRLNPEKTPSQNAQYYFKQYQKLKSSVHYLRHEIEHAKQEINYFEILDMQLAQSDISNIEAIKDELVKGNYLKRNSHKSKGRNAQKSKPFTFISDDGTLIKVGKNNLQNERLSLRDANKAYLWLHAKNIPGSHVVIESTAPTDETITLAAELAAYYSKFKDSANVPVDIVPVSKLRKPNGSKPGFVVYEGQKTVYVTPKESLIEEHHYKK